MYYELAFLTNPHLDPKDRAAEEVAVSKLLEEMGAKIEQTLAAESRPLGYHINKVRQSWLHSFIFSITDPSQLNHLAGKLRLRPHVLRFTTVAHGQLPNFTKIRSVLAAARVESRKAMPSRVMMSSRAMRRNAAPVATKAAEATTEPATNKDVTPTKGDAPKKRRKSKNIEESIAAMVGDKIEV